MASLPYPRCHQTIFPQKFLAEKSLPQIARMYTEVSGARYSPTDFTDVHRLRGYGIPAIPTQPPNYLPTEATEPTEASGREEKSVSICEICGITSCARNFCEFCEFCGRIGRGRRGYGRMPYPPTKTPTDCTDVHRFGGKNAT